MNMSLFNKIGFILLAFTLPVTEEANASQTSHRAYWAERRNLVREDLEEMLGHDLALSLCEERVNTFLKDLKQREMNYSFHTLDFFPAFNFLEAKDQIDESKVFKFIQAMPKGAILHSHQSAMTSIKWIISEIMYWDDLYMCEADDSSIRFRFFSTPDPSCNWTLVSQVRASYPTSQDFDNHLHDILTLRTSDVKNTYTDINSIWTRFETLFRQLAGLLGYYEAQKASLERAVIEMMEDRVAYWEFRGTLGPLYDKDGKVFSPEKVVEILNDVLKNVSRQYSQFYGAKFIYSPPRSVDVNKMWENVRLMNRLRTLFPDFVIGFDLIGQEDFGQPLKSFLDPLLSLRQQHPPISFFFHAGETSWQGMSTDENLFDALLLNATRIGHAYALEKHPVAMKIVKQKDIAIEVSPISNQVLMLLNDLRNHPAADLIARSFPLVISSDDPALWGASPLSHDYYEAFMALGGAKADLKLLKKLASNSIRYSALNPRERRGLFDLWQKQWKEFIQKIIDENL